MLTYSKNIALRLSAAPLALGLALAAAPAFAQDQAADDNAADVIVVTGSRITNPNLVTSSPVKVLGAEELQLRQTVNAEDLVGDLPGVTTGISSAVNNGSNGTSTFNLRGLGDNRNLVLIDGNRIVPSGLSSVVDLNNIPTALIERTEVLTGGASSVYGADAVAGVLNFVMKKDFSGVQLNTSYGLTEEGDGDTFNADITMGGNFADGRGNAVVSFGYQNVKPVLMGDRSFSRETLDVDGSLVGSGTSTPTRVNLINLRDANDKKLSQFDPDTGTLVPTYNTYNFAPDNYFQTPRKRYNAYASAWYDLTDSVELYAKGMFNRTTVNLQLAPSGMFGDTWQLPLNNPFLPAGVQQQLCADNGITDCAGAIANGTEITTTINRRFVEMGARKAQYTTNMFQGWVGARGDLTDLIKFDVSASYGESEKTRTYNNWGLKSRVQQALRAVDANTCVDESNGCVPINLFGDGKAISDGTIAFINAPTIVQVKTSMSVLNATLNGDLTETGFLGATTPIGFALGGEYRKYTADQVSDSASSTQDEVLGTGAPSPSYSGEYDVWEAYAELNVPLIEDQPFINSLSAEGGIRYSHYSTSGDTWTYKGGLNWEPIDGLRFRGNYQHAVRAPNLEELFLPASTGLGSLSKDPCAGPGISATLSAICIAQGAPAAIIGNIDQPSASQINVTQGGSLSLKPEKADSYTLGMVVTPTQVPGLSFTADYYHIKITDPIEYLSTNTILNACYDPNNDGDYSDANPNAPECALIGRNPLNGSLNGGGDTPGVTLALGNQDGEIISSGIDVSVAYSRPTNFGGLNFSFNGNWTDQFLTADGVECAGKYGSTCDPMLPKFSFQFRSTVSLDNIGDFSLLWHWMDGMEYEDRAAELADPESSVLPEYMKIDSYSTFDLTYRKDVFENVTFTMGVSNLFDKKPPIVSNYIGDGTYNAGNTYPSTYDALGRRYMATLSAKF
ncbi:TonB-dependent receptor [Altererythrobacter indicus]|uniref:TonB-dependent receptor n=1 Tax=Altericroceibacterium indicum TaxID=374177 RepID=A0A845AD01_9SPHN|nr:TonB-dependent receptor [Altericroceibacterium indicum]